MNSALERAAEIERDFYYLKSVELGPLSTITEVKSAVESAIAKLRDRAPTPAGISADRINPSPLSIRKQMQGGFAVRAQAYLSKIPSMWEGPLEKCVKIVLRNPNLSRADLMIWMCQDHPILAPGVIAYAKTLGYIQTGPHFRDSPVTVTLEGLLFLSKRNVDRMTPEAKAAMLAEQARSWVRGNMELGD